MRLDSPVLKHNQSLPAKYTCDGEGVSPPLEFVDVPQEAVSLVLMVTDPDAPTKTWVHWVVFDIDPTTTEVTEDAIPKGGVQGMNDSGKTNYVSLCPPSGKHRYIFTLHALDTTLNLKKGVSYTEVEEQMEGHILVTADLVTTYIRQ